MSRTRFPRGCQECDGSGWISLGPMYGYESYGKPCTTCARKRRKEERRKKEERR